MNNNDTGQGVSEGARIRGTLGQNAQSACLAVLTIMALFGAAKILSSVLMPIVFAWILTALLAPFVKFMSNRCRIPYPVAVFVAIALTLLLFFQIGIFMNGLLASFIAKRKEYLEKLTELFAQFCSYLPTQVAGEIKEYDWIGRMSREVLKISAKVFSGSSTVMMSMIIATFMFFEQRDFRIKLIKAFRFKEATRIDGILLRTSEQVSRYLILQVAISAATGFFIWLALFFIGVDFAPTWGVLAFVLNFIPTIGSIIASIPPILTALVQYAPETYWPMIAATLAILVIQMTIGNFLAPRILGDNLNLSPAVVIISLLFWGWLWGPAGALISVPITASIKIACDSFSSLAPLGVLLGSGKVLRKEQNRKNKGKRRRKPRRQSLIKLADSASERQSPHSPGNAKY